MPYEQNPNQCAICGCSVVQTSAFPIYFCKAHFEQWKPAIFALDGWTRFLKNEEKNRRRARNRKQRAGYCELPLKGE